MAAPPPSGHPWPALRPAKISEHETTRNQDGDRCAFECLRGDPGQHHTAFVFVETTPDAVRFTDFDGVIQAIPLHAALRANCFGGPLTAFFVFFALKVSGWKEHR